LSWEGIPGTGALATYAELAAVTSISLDLWGYGGEWEIDRRSIGVGAEGTFDPLLLPGGSPSSVRVENRGLADTAFDLSWEPFSGVSIGVLVNLAPTLETLFSGFSIEQADGSLIDQDGESVLLDVPEDGRLDVTSTYSGAWTSSLDLLITPTLQVCASILGCYDVASFDLPVSLYSDTTLDRFEPQEYSFELPVFEVPDAEYDFGEIEVGRVATWELTLRNLGALALDGSAGVYGDLAFSVWPDEILADGPGTDGVVVTFAPTSPGAFAATLSLSSNDPFHPLYEIALRGSAFEEVVDTGLAIEEKVGGCECGQARGPRGGWLGLLAPLALLIARRRGTSISRPTASRGAGAL
jgi:hypothetical protein